MTEPIGLGSPDEVDCGVVSMWLGFTRCMRLSVTRCYQGFGMLYDMFMCCRRGFLHRSWAICIHRDDIRSNTLRGWGTP